ncbi:RsmB/NOP family class I SAM-dependent RNA methyltransferase [Pseudopelagicola sp. nBUS_20]|uniref:RsmB/NOP family class I SAM-dependent RNA methyltransferase n=1 Tax=Pseudopelagicola sp. nBUS_20 TaxID=3395317 RepID=UPI003EB93AB3
MTPGARVQAAIELLDDILDGVPAEKALTGWSRRSRFAGSKDRVAVRDYVFDALRRRNSVAALGGAFNGRGLMIGLLRQSETDLSSVFTGIAYAPNVLTKEEEHGAACHDLPLDVPDWLTSQIRETLGENAESSIQILKERAPISLRVNLQRVSRENAQKRLRSNGVETCVSDKATSGLLVEQGARRISQSGAYKEGLVELQDISSQVAVEALPLTDSMSVLDFCAGGGGKLLAMAGRVRANFYAHDALKQRLRDLPGRARRAGVRVVQTDVPEKHAPYDLIFCDVPCSGSGTWRRTPDAKWRLSPDDLNKMTELQQSILQRAYPMVAIKGYLVYATCSILNIENTVQTDKFLTATTGWRMIGSRQLPITEDCDGFYFAIFRRMN